MRIALALAGLLVAAAAQAVSARSGLVLLSMGDHYAVMRAGGQRLQEVLRLGRSVSYGESDDAFVFLTDRFAEVGTWVAEIVDKQTHTVVWSHPISATPVIMLQGTVKDVLLTRRAVYFVSVRRVESPADLNSAGGFFDLNVLSRVDGREEVIPLPRDMGTSLSNESGIAVLRNRDGTEWRVNVANRALEPVENTTDLSALERGNADEVRERFRVLYKGAVAIGVVRGRGREHEQWTLAYVDPLKKTDLWEKPLPDSVQPESVFVGPDGWNYYIDTKSGAVTGISGEPGTRELWKLPTDYLFDAHILEIDAE